MAYQYTPYTLPLAFAGALALASAYLAWGKRDRAGVRWYGATMVAIAVWSASLALVVSSTTLRGKLIWFAVLLPTTAYLAISWTLFAVTYTGREAWVTRTRLAFLALSPIPWLVLTLTTDAHGLVLVAPRLDASGDFVRLAYDWGPVVWLYVAYGYALLAVGNSLLFWKFLHSRNIYRKYSFSMFVGGVFLWFATIPSFAGLSPFPHLMLLPMGFFVVGVVSVAFLYSVKFVKLVPMDQILGRFSARFESLLPLARDYIVEELDSGVIVLDAEDRIVDINPMGRRIIGEDRQVVGRRIYDVVDLEAVLSEFEPGDELTEFTGVEWVHTPNGLRCFDITVSNLTDSTGALAGRVALVYDITAQKRREEALEEREAELEAQKRNLQQQAQKLEHQNERLDEFASIVSHDLRNPLNVASGHLTLIEGEEYREQVEQIRDAHDRMEAIIDDALTLARQGKAITETEPVSVAEAAERAWATVETDRATLEVTADGTVDADRERLRTAFENLFRNALEHGRPPEGADPNTAEHGGDEGGGGDAGGDGRDEDEPGGNEPGGDEPVVETTEATDAVETTPGGGAAVTVRVGDLPDGGFFVEDDGPGIPAAEREDVFDRGYTTTEDGTGLGLAIVANVVNAHGWSIRVTDGDAGGARFEVEQHPE